MRMEKRIGVFISLFLLVILALVELGFAGVISTQADGMIVWGALNNASPAYRSWNVSNNFSSVKYAEGMGTNASVGITWVSVLGLHEYDQILAIVIDSSNTDVGLQIYNNSAGYWWPSLTFATGGVSTNYPSSSQAVEDISGETIIVFDATGSSGPTMDYITWNGTRLSGVSTVNHGLPSTTTRWYNLYALPGTDQMMLTLMNASGGLYAVPWNGTKFEVNSNLTISNSTNEGGLLTEPQTSFSWESLSGEGVIFYGEGLSINMRTYNITSPQWSDYTNLSGLGGNNIDAVRSCSDPTSDFIGVIWQDSGNDVNMSVWNGTEIVAGGPLEDDTTANAGSFVAVIDCAWINDTSALFGYINSSTQALSYFFFHKPSTWSVSNINASDATVNFANTANLITGLRFSRHPITSEVMVTAYNFDQDVVVIRWNGTAFVPAPENPLEVSTDIVNGANEMVAFDWFRYDPVPNVTGLQPAGLVNFSATRVFDINVTITDNYQVDTVMVNVSFPNGSAILYTLTNRTGNNTFYNFTLRATSGAGKYNYTIIVNDTSRHRNFNRTEMGFFNITTIWVASTNANCNDALWCTNLNAFNSSNSSHPGNISSYKWRRVGQANLLFLRDLDFSTIGSIDANFYSDYRLFSLNSSRVPSLNATANLTLENVSSTVCNSKDIVRSSEPYATLATTQENGVSCRDRCSNFVYRGTTPTGNCTFQVSEFSGFAAGANSNLTINDSSEGSSTSVLNALSFFAYYINSSGDYLRPVAGSGCNATFDDASTVYNMTFNLTGDSSYNVTKAAGFTTGGVHVWNVTCGIAGYSGLTANDTISLYELTGVPEFEDYALLFILVTVISGFLVMKKINEGKAY